MPNDEGQQLLDEVIEVILKLDHFRLQKLSAFLAGLESAKAQEHESEGGDHGGE